MDTHDTSSAGANLSFFRLRNPFVQILLSSACLFCNPGLYLAVTLLGAGGGRPSSIDMANISNGALYGVFTFSAIFAPVALNHLGPRITMMFAVTGYPIYIGALWYFDSYGHLWYPVLAGAYLGLTAGCLWTTAAYMSTAYPEEKDRGLWRAIQWSSNVSGASVGACVALGISWNAKSESVPHSVYIVFIVLQICSLGFAFFLLPTRDLIRSDGTPIAVHDRPTVKDTLKQTGRLFKDWRIWIMIPCFFTPEVFFPFQASMNAYVFNLRTRTLNSLLNNLIQIPTCFAMGYILDNEKIGSRRKRLLIAIAADAVWITGAYIAQTAWLASWNFDRSVPGPMIDCTDPAYAGAIVIYMLYAAQYGIFQNVVIYVYSTFTNDPRKTAAMSGLFVGILSSGTAISFGVDATAPPYENENAAYFSLATICWPILAFVAYKCTTDTNYGTEEDVVVPFHIRKELQIDGLTADGRPSTDGEALPEKTLPEKA